MNAKSEIVAPNQNNQSVSMNFENTEAMRTTRGSIPNWIKWPIALMIVGIIAGLQFDASSQLKFVLWLSFGIAALSLDFVWGKAGIFSFGQNALFGLGGYVYAVVALNLFPTTFETGSALIAAILVAALFSALLGYIMFYGEVGDVYLAIVTLAVTLVLYTIMQSTAGPEYRIGEALLGGFNGIPSLPTIALGIPGDEDTTEFTTAGLLVFSIVLSGILYLIISYVSRSRFGLILEGIKENEIRMDLLGYDIRKYKLAAFTIGGGVAGIGGALFAAWGMFINPVVFSLNYAALIVIWVMVGGRGTLAGAFLGVVIVQWISDEADQIIAQQTPLILGILLILVVLLFPQGIYPALHNRIAKLAHKHKSDPNSEKFSSTHKVTTPAVDITIEVKPRSEEPILGSMENAGRISASGIRKAFGGVVVLDGITLDFEGPGIHAVIGPNGAGKSTFFATLTGRHTTNEGEIRLNDTSITSLRPFERARLGLGIKLQIPSIFLGLTVRQNLMLAIGSKNRSDENSIVSNILVDLGLDNRLDTMAETLSHGEQQWLEICMVLVQNPSVILLDEPAAGMTRDERARTVEIIRKLATNKTVIVVEHDMSFIRALRAPVSMLDRGKVFRSGSFEELSSDPEVIRIYMGRRNESHS